MHETSAIKLSTLPNANTGTIVVDAIGDEDDPAWDEFVNRTPGGSFYHLSGWKRINENHFGHNCEWRAARDASGTIVGALPLVFVRSRLFGRILCSIPFLNYGGPVAGRRDVATKLVDDARARAEALGADYLELRCTGPLDTNMEASLRKISMTVGLADDADVLWSGFTSKHRTAIRRAFKNDFEVRSGGPDLLDDFYFVLERSWHGLGTPLYSKSFFRSVLEVFPDQTRIFVCRRQGQAIAVAFNGYHNGTVEGMWAGALPESRQLQPNYALYWEMLRDACERGCRTYHLGRSTADSGAEQFKRKWNAESVQLYWYQHRPGGGEAPQLNVDNQKYRLAIQIWRRLPLRVTRTIGPRIARSIP